MWFRRQTSGSVVCPSCGSLVGVRDEACLSCGRRNPGMWGYAPLFRQLGRDLGFVPFVMTACGALYVVSLLLSGSDIQMRGIFSMLSPSVPSLFILGASGAAPVFGYHRWWTVLTAGWLHAGLLHIALNMLWVRQLAPATADTYGPGRLVIIYIVAGVCGFTLSAVAGEYFIPIPFLRGADFTVGASAPIFGLLGALVYYGQRSGSRMMHSQVVSYALTLGLFGLIMPGVDNYAHAGGFAGGYLVGKWLDPLQPERGDHLALAFGALGLTALAILVSIVTGIAVFLR
jgi:rhomboid protease GluP